MNTPITFRVVACILLVMPRLARRHGISQILYSESNVACLVGSNSGIFFSSKRHPIGLEILFPSQPFRADKVSFMVAPSLTEQITNVLTLLSRSVVAAVL